MFLSRCPLVDQQLAEKRQHSGAEESATPPEGISQNDWDRVTAYQKQARDEVEVPDLARPVEKANDLLVARRQKH